MCLPFPDLAEKTLAQGEHQGFMWEVVHNHRQVRCGYVRVNPGHPWFGKHYDDIDATVHGGLTFSDAGQACPTHGPDAEWWVGFDCGHYGDAPDLTLPAVSTAASDLALMGILARSFLGDSASSRGEIRSQEYVEAECRSLCEQAAKASMGLKRRLRKIS